MLTASVGCPRPSPAGDVLVLALAALAAVLAQREHVEITVLAWRTVLVLTPPGIFGRRLAQIRPPPARLVARLGPQRAQPLFGAGIVTGVQAELVQRLGQGIDLGRRGLDLGLADLSEETRAHIPGQQADDDQHDQQLEQRETTCLGVFHRAGCWKRRKTDTASSHGNLINDAVSVWRLFQQPAL